MRKWAMLESNLPGVGQCVYKVGSEEGKSRQFSEVVTVRLFFAFLYLKIPPLWYAKNLKKTPKRGAFFPFLDTLAQLFNTFPKNST